MRTELDTPATPDTLAASHSVPPGGSTAISTPLVLVHGFAQNRRCWGPLAARLAARHPLSLLDAPGHGASRLHANASVRDGAALVASTAARWQRPVVLVGYSMGARLCLTAAIEHPESVAAVVLIGGTPGMSSATERAQRCARDDALAQRLPEVGVATFLAEWLAMDMFAQLPSWARFDDERRTNSAAGLAASLRNAGTGSMPPLWERLTLLRPPTLCLAGAADVRYAEIASRIAAASPAATAARIPGAGHAAHLERPGRVGDIVDAWLDRVASDEGDRPLRR